MRFIIALFLFTFCTANIFAQENHLFEKEQELKNLGDSILRGRSDSARIISSALFEKTMEHFLNDRQSFNYRFDSLKNVSALKSSDGLIRIYTWLLPAMDGTKHSYFGYIQLLNKKDNTVTVYKLQETEINRNEVEKKTYDYKNWIGALYYKMIAVKSKDGNYYTLLGWKGNNRQSTIKLIDVLKINKGIPMFGAPVFYIEKGVRHRIVFEYNARAVMSLKYLEKDKLIAFDHLSPPNPELTGNYASYGPDFTYDGFKLVKGKWNYIKNIEPQNDPDFDQTKSPAKINNKEFYKPDK